MRDGCIDMRKDELEKMVCELEVYNFGIDGLFVIGGKEGINSRVVVVRKNKRSKKVCKILVGCKGDGGLVGDIIYGSGIKVKDRGVRKIREREGRNWGVCKKIGEVCNELCEDFELDRGEGFIKYMEVGMKKMEGNYNKVVKRLCCMWEKIWDLYCGRLEMEDDCGNGKGMDD